MPNYDLIWPSRGQKKILCDFKIFFNCSARNVTLTVANTHFTLGHGDTALFIANPDGSGLEQVWVFLTGE